MEIEKEKRKSPRVEINWPATVFYDDEKIEGETKNISAEGVSLQCEKPLPVNKVLSILINPPDHQAIGLKGEVAWADMYGIEGAGKGVVYGLGACLVELSEDDKSILREMLSKYL